MCDGTQLFAPSAVGTSVILLRMRCELPSGWNVSDWNSGDCPRKAKLIFQQLVSSWSVCREPQVWYFRPSCLSGRAKQSQINPPAHPEPILCVHTPVHRCVLVSHSCCPLVPGCPSSLGLVAAGLYLLPSCPQPLLSPCCRQLRRAIAFVNNTVFRMPFCTFLQKQNLKRCASVWGSFSSVCWQCYLFACVSSACKEWVRVVCAMCGYRLVLAKARKMYDKQTPFLLLWTK